MAKSKRMKEITKQFGSSDKFSIEQAVEKVQECSSAKFVESLDIAIKLGIDPRKPEQQVRGSTSLPHGTGKSVRVVVIAEGEQANIAEKAGADFVGSKEIETKILGGWMDFDIVISSPDMMGIVGKLGRKLGPRGLMPSPKAGTLTSDIGKAVSEFKKGKVEIRSNRQAGVNLSVGKVSMDKKQLVENVEQVIDSINKMKPTSATGKYLQSVYLSSTMGLGFKVDVI